MFDRFFKPKPEPKADTLQVGSKSVPLLFVHNPKARRYLLRLRSDGVARVTVPRRGSLYTAREFVGKNIGWLSDHKFNLRFILTEWDQVVDAWQLQNWESYKDVARLGRKTRLSEAQRKVLWDIFERVHAGLKERKLKTQSGVFTALASVLTGSKKPPFDFAIVDEAQDISV